ncbi:MAG TPA: triose-phosphate isomerase [Bacteroidota bacterium]|nr:triose-phosphate isomerase [Bacteroidota bacterium]
MRRTVIAGNWKMYKDVLESSQLVEDMKKGEASIPSNITTVVCPPSTSLAIIGNMLKGSSIKLGAQNMSEHDEGAYTGEISWNMLKSTGTEYVILGHSERRQYFQETNELINLKVKKALQKGLSPIVCVGERLNEREQGITEPIVKAQVKGVLAELKSSDVEKTIIAYEPVWAIGTGKTATPQQAQDVHKMIRKLVAQLYDWPVADRLVIQYGGSVKPENANELLSQPDIDGALVGGASLKAEGFLQIIHAAKK